MRSRQLTSLVNKFPSKLSHRLRILYEQLQGWMYGLSDEELLALSCHLESQNQKGAKAIWGCSVESMQDLVREILWVRGRSIYSKREYAATPDPNRRHKRARDAYASRK